MAKGRAEQVGALIAWSFVMPLLFFIAIASLANAPPPHAAPSGATPSATTRDLPTITDTYRVRYQARGNVYCIRIFADPAPAEPYPRVSGDTCQSRAKWAKEGLTIRDPRRDAVDTEAKS